MSHAVCVDCVSCACPGAAAAARAAPSPGHLPAAHCGAVATCPNKIVLADCVCFTCPGAAAAVARGAPSPGHLPQDMCVMDVVSTIAKIKGISEKGHAAQISKGRKG